MADTAEADPWQPPEGVEPFVHETAVRFADVDGMRHVNNAMYVTYLENARTAWVHDVDDPRTFDDIEFILARVEVDYKAAATLRDTVRVQMWVPRIGRKSWDFAYRLTDLSGETLFALAKTTQVAFDYEAGISIQIPPRYLTSLKRLAGEG